MLMSADMPGPAAPSFPMRRLLFAGGAVLLLVPHGFGSTDFSGTWVLDLCAANSPDQILKRLGASWVERQPGSSVQLESTCIQTPHFLTLHIGGPAFQRTDLMRTGLGITPSRWQWQYYIEGWGRLIVTPEPLRTV
jgi:hypothetical protein